MLGYQHSTSWECQSVRNQPALSGPSGAGWLRYMSMDTSNLLPQGVQLNAKSPSEPLTGAISAFDEETRRFRMLLCQTSSGWLAVWRRSIRRPSRHLLSCGHTHTSSNRCTSRRVVQGVKSLEREEDDSGGWMRAHASVSELRSQPRHTTVASRPPSSRPTILPSAHLRRGPDHQLGVVLNRPAITLAISVDLRNNHQQNPLLRFGMPHA